MTMIFHPSGSSKVKSDRASRKPIAPFQKSYLGSNLVSVTVFKIFWMKRLWPWPLTSQGHPNWSPWALYVISVGFNVVTLAVLDIFYVKKYKLDLWPSGSSRSNLTVPIESPWVLHKWSRGRGSNLVTSPFSTYFESKDFDVDLRPLRVIQGQIW